VSYGKENFFHFFLDMRAEKWDIHVVMRTPFTTTITREILNADFDSIGEIEIDIEGTYYHGCPAKGPSYSSGGEPEEHPEVEITSSFHRQEEINLTEAEIEEIEEKILNDPPSSYDSSEY
jgi:hypothetical protein